MQRIFVVGAGTMGLDIAQVFAAAGKDVTVRDISGDILDKASAKLTKGLARRVEKGKLRSGSALVDLQSGERLTLGSSSLTVDLPPLTGRFLLLQ